MHLSQVKIVSRATSEGVGTQSSLTIYESPGAVRAAESILHL
jgi:hypothetical protein